MKTTFIYTALSAFILFISCNKLSKQEQEFDILMEKVIGVHDEVMPKMGNMSALIKELEPKIDTTSQGQQYKNAQTELKKSYDFMMKWMGDFGNKFPPSNDENTPITEEKLAKNIAMLQKEEVLVHDLKNQINSSIKNAKDLLKKE